MNLLVPCSLEGDVLQRATFITNIWSEVRRSLDGGVYYKYLVRSAAFIRGRRLLQIFGQKCGVYYKYLVRNAAFIRGRRLLQIFGQKCGVH